MGLKAVLKLRESGKENMTGSESEEGNAVGVETRQRSSGGERERGASSFYVNDRASGSHVLTEVVLQKIYYQKKQLPLMRVSFLHL